jgi:hypothetical protein
MTDIAVTCDRAGDGWTCAAQVTASDGSRTSHEVRVTQADLERFDPGASGPVDLVRRSFDFLLAREPRESILRSFDLPVIARYFPEYERAIRA